MTILSGTSFHWALNWKEVVRIKEFITAARVAEEGDAPETVFKVDGIECTAYKPEDGQLAILMATTGRHSNLHEKIAGVINFFVATLDEKSHHHLVDRLLDRKDPFGIEEVTDIMKNLVEEWTGHPTESSSGSPQSRSSGGRKSTPRTPVST